MWHESKYVKAILCKFIANFYTQITLYTIVTSIEISKYLEMSINATHIKGIQHQINRTIKSQQILSNRIFSEWVVTIESH